MSLKKSDIDWKLIGRLFAGVSELTTCLSAAVGLSYLLKAKTSLPAWGVIAVGGGVALLGFYRLYQWVRVWELRK